MIRRLQWGSIALLGLVTPHEVNAARGAPDAAGYTWSDHNEPFVDRSIPLGIGLPLEIAMADETVSAETTFPNGFSFPFYSQSYTSFRISDNGWMTFDPSVSAATPAPGVMPSAAALPKMLAVYWRDLVPAPLPNALQMLEVRGGVYFRYLAQLKPTLEDVSLHWVLYASGAIKVWYEVVAQPGSVATGIQRDSTTGLQPIFRGSSPEGFVLAVDSVLMYFPKPQLSCGSAQALACGVGSGGAVTVPTGPHAAGYLCSPNTYLAQEKVYRLDVPDLSNVRLELSNVSPSSITLDLFVIAETACNEFQCIGGGAPAIDLPFLSPGRYYVVVDGRTTLDTGTFTLTATCTKKGEASPCQAFADPPRAGATSGTSTFQDYPACAGFVPLDGPEYVHEVDFTTPGNLRARLSNVTGGDLDLLLFRKGSVTPAACLAWGDDNLIVFDPPLGTYEVMVDGKAGFAGPYDIKITCGVAANCATPGTALTCQTPIAGTTTGAPNRVDEYSCLPDVFDGGEAGYRLTTTAVGTLGLRLDAPPDVSLLVMQGSCNEAKCIAEGTSIVLRDLPAGDYYLLVDGKNQAAGDYTITPVCAPDLTPRALDVVLGPGQCASEAKTGFVNGAMGPIDVLFIQDASRSETDWVTSGLVGAVDLILGAVGGLSSDLQFGLATFRDYPVTPNFCGYNVKYGDPADYPWRVEQAITSDRVALTTRLQAITPADGGDYPESYARAWYEAYTDPNVGWRPDSQRLVVMIGDDVPHDCDVGRCLGATKQTRGVDLGPDGAENTSDDLFIMTEMDEVKKRFLKPVFVFNPTNLRPPFDDLSHGEIFQLWNCWTQRAGGIAIYATSGVFQPDHATMIRDYLESTAGVCRELKVAPSAGYTDWMQALSPASITDFAVPGQASFQFDLCPPTGAPAGIHNFTVDLLCEGRRVASQTVRVSTSNCTYTPTVAVSGRLCEGEARTFDATGSTIGNCPGAYDYQWREPDGDLLRAWDSSPIFSGPIAVGGDYTLEIRCQDQIQCPGNGVKTFPVSVTPGPPASAGPDVAACLNQTITLGTPGQAGLTYQWSPTTYMSPPAGNVAQPTVTPTSTTPPSLPYTLTVTDTATGCTRSDAVTLAVVSGAPAGSVGNNLKAVDAGADVYLEWPLGALSPKLYNVHRTDRKAELLLPAPIAPRVAGVGNVETWTDTGAMASGPPFAALLFYQVYGRDCAGNSIFQ